MEIIIIFCGCYFAWYCYHILQLISGYGKVKPLSGKGSQTTGFSIVVPFRNEAKNLPALLESIKNQNYPIAQFEIILVDDFSEDDGEKVVYRWRMENGEFHVTLLENVRVSGSPKKDAIARAIPIAAYDWIITTDADCVLPTTWLSTYDALITQTDAKMVAGPIVYPKKFSLLNHFERADLLSLQGATIGSFGQKNAFMCNGANFAYTKKFFNELGGFSGSGKWPGGDDVFLLQKAVDKNPKAVHYLKSDDAIVTTQTAKKFSELFHQRVRWAAKTRSYQSIYAESLALAVLLGNATVLLLFVLSAMGKLRWEFPLVAFAVKFLIDWILMMQARKFLYKKAFCFPIVSAVFYPIFSLIVGVYSLVGKYRWKGRSFG